MVLEERTPVIVPEQQEDRDKEIAVLAARGDRQAEEALVMKYAKLVHLKCRAYFVMGAEKEDLFQEGMIGLIEAIRGFSPEKHRSFSSFAGICITRQILTAVKTGNRLKHSPLNTSVSFDHGEDDDESMLEMLPDQSVRDPEETFILKEDRRRLHESVNRLLTKQEQTVFTAYMNGYSYEIIAREMCLSIKAVDNSLQRVKRKIRQKEAWRL